MNSPVPINPNTVVPKKPDEVCYACGGVSDELVEDHCHWTGNFRGYACLSCNAKMREPQYIPVFFHNGGGFDFHFIIQTIAEIGKICR